MSKADEESGKPQHQEKPAEKKASAAERAGLPPLVGESLLRCATCGESFVIAKGLAVAPPHQLQPGWLCAGSEQTGVIRGQR